MTVKCPTCRKAVAWNGQSPYRPFCSHRCQQIDFGEWAAERHSIPGEEFSPDCEDDGSFDH